MSFMVESVTVGNVPDTPVVVSGERAATLTDLLSFLCFSEHVCLDGFHGSEDGGVSLAFLDDEPVAHFVAVLQVGGKFVHALIIGQLKT